MWNTMESISFHLEFGGIQWIPVEYSYGIDTNSIWIPLECGGTVKTSRSLILK